MERIEQARADICSLLCNEVSTTIKGNHLLVSLPLERRDGDMVTLFVEPMTAGWRISDVATTLMRLSYENDLSKLLAGARGKLFYSLLSESGLSEDDGEIFCDVPSDQLAAGLFKLAQGIVRVEDLGLWTRSRTESTFYDDLREKLISMVPSERLSENYVVPNVEQAENYVVDYMVETGGRPLFIFGVNGRDKARLATITLQHIQQVEDNFDSLVVFSHLKDIPQGDVQRLMVAANDIVPDLAETAGLKKKLQHRMVS